MYKNISVEQKSTWRGSSVKKKETLQQTGVSRGRTDHAIRYQYASTDLPDVGVWLDKHFGTNFWMILLFCMGAVAGGQNVYRMARTIYDDSDDKHIKKDK